MWSASIKAISDAPLFGYNINDRFNAIKPYLHPSVPNYTHPHNDIFASIISAGFLGGFAAFISLIASFLGALLSKYDRSEKLYFGFMLSCSTLVTANVSTVFFNDICSAWLVFSTYLIWTADFREHQNS
jgi:O-antigen ligase